MLSAQSGISPDLPITCPVQGTARQAPCKVTSVSALFKAATLPSGSLATAALAKSPEDARLTGAERGRPIDRRLCR